jgi:excisionase family DNA binding protein
MKTELEQADIEAIAQRVIELLKPLISGNGRQETEDGILDVKGLCDYLHVSVKWIYERTHLKEIPHLKVNGLLRFRKKDIDKWLNSFNVPALSTPERVLRAVK